jgi:hypothetical protein
MRVFPRVAVLVAVCALFGSVLSAQAPTPLATADAGKFMGAWLLTLESPQGAFSMTLTLSDSAGKVTGEMTSDMMPTQRVDDISKAGNDIVLKYQGDFQGQAFAAKITLTPVDDTKVSLNFDVMDGQFVMTGVGTKK